MKRLLFVLTALFSLNVNAQTITASSADLQQQKQVQAVTAATYESSLNTNLQSGIYAVSNTAKTTAIRPYGAELFDGGFSGVRADGLNPAYKVSSGDQIILRAWGAIEVDRVLPVDSQGNIFIPSIGPVAVAGISHRELDSVVRSAVKTIYPNNVNVYTNLMGVQPVAIYVTGFVNRPGKYAGTPNDSVIYYLHAAGGIKPELGSYRRINVSRYGEIVKTIDLYEFLNKGVHPDFQFEDGDTLFVSPKSVAVTVEGDVALPAVFESLMEESSAADLVELSNPIMTATDALVRGYRNGQPYSKYLQLADLVSEALEDGDHILVKSDHYIENIVVQVEGSFLGGSTFTVPKDTTLKELLSTIPVEQAFAETESVSLRRLSVKQRQQASLNESLRRLESTYLGASSSTAEEAGIRVREAELIQRFVQKARQAKPSGRLVVAREDSIVDIRLQDGDVITIPERSDSLLISGEVLVPQSVVFDEGVSAKDYIKGAGGFTQYADKDRILVVRKNGEVRRASEVKLRGGDEILVLPKAPTKNLQLASTISQIVYQIAVAARVAVDI